MNPSHNWRLKPGWKQFYYCTVCGVDDVHPKAHEKCNELNTYAIPQEAAAHDND